MRVSADCGVPNNRIRWYASQSEAHSADQAPTRRQEQRLVHVRAARQTKNKAHKESHWAEALTICVQPFTHDRRTADTPGLQVPAKLLGGWDDKRASPPTPYAFMQQLGTTDRHVNLST